MFNVLSHYNAKARDNIIHIISSSVRFEPRLFASCFSSTRHNSRHTRFALLQDVFIFNNNLKTVHAFIAILLVFFISKKQHRISSLHKFKVNMFTIERLSLALRGLTSNGKNETFAVGLSLFEQ